MNISLHIFTNCCKQYPLDKLLQTYESFCSTFGKITPTIWIDPHPKKDTFKKYVADLTSAGFNNLHKCNSLSHGYIKAIQNSTSDFCFMLEHDWIFLPVIKHSLSEIIEVMNNKGLYHFRFNKRSNKLHHRTDRTLRQFDYNGISYCITPFLSNNPHIINRKSYMQFIKSSLIQIRPKSHGIEEIISRHPKTQGAIYGVMGHPQAVQHLDARGHYKKRGKV